MFEALSEGVNGWAVFWGALASFLLGLLWLRTAGDTVLAKPQIIAATLPATLLLAWVVGLMERRQAFFEMVLVVITIAAFVSVAGLFGGTMPRQVVRVAGYVLASALVMYLAQLVL